MIDISRPRLVSELVELTRSGSVMLTGAPGVGKSWLLGQLTRRCRQESRLVTTLIAEEFQVSRLQEIYDSLGFSKPLPKLLASLSDPVLIIDGLDALRGDASQRAFRELINEVIDQAPNASIVASVRTFDLQESSELQRLLNRRTGSGRGMRRLVVGELSDAELLDASAKNPELLSLLDGKSTPLFELLRNPFNLHLAFSLLKLGISLDELRLIQSQVQLLEQYWRYRVLDSPDGVLRERVLKTISDQMVKSKTLSVPESDIAEPGYQDALFALKSSEVLRKSTTGRLFYSHNILFDYAIARLLLDEYRIFDFVREDAARSLFFRPSLTFFFHRLWAFDRELFWKVTRDLLSTNDLPERMRVVPAVVVSEAARSAEEIETNAFQIGLGDVSVRFVTLLLRAVLAVRALDGRRRGLWLDWLVQLSNQMRVDWVNEMLTGVASVHSTMAGTEVLLIGRIARNILFWEIQPPAELNEQQAINLSSVVSGRILPIVADTYDSDAAESERAILAIANRVGSPQSASNEAFWLSNILPNVIERSPSLAEKIYLRLYSASEESEEKTSLGGGIVMPLTSTRKQDFSSSLYGLMARFKLFLDLDSVRAARVAIQATEIEVARERKRDEKREYDQVRFRLGRRTVVYQADYSEIWDGASSRDLTSLSLLDSALEFASQAAEEIRSQMISEVCRYASLGVSWRRLMLRAKLHPKALYSDVRELLFIPKFISAPEVTVDVGEILKAAYSQELVSQEDAGRIENAIVHIEGTKIIRRYERPSTIQQRLLGCLPQGAVKNPTLIEKLSRWGTKKPKENKPFFRSSFGAFTPDINDEYRRSGIDPASSPNAEVIAASNEVREFESRHLNSTANNSDSEAMEPKLRRLHDLVREEGVSAQVAENGRGVLYAAVNVISRNHELGAESSLIHLCRAYAIEGSTDKDPVFDAKYHLPFDTSGWGSPSSRIEALQALGQLIWNYFSDKEIVEAFLKASSDEVPAVRYQVARYLTSLYKRDLKDEFWQALTAMIEAETTSGVMLALLNSLQAVSGPEPEKTMEIVEAVIARGLPSTDRSETRQALTGIPVGLYAVQGLERARAVLLRFAGDPGRYHAEISTAIFIASHYFDPKKTSDSTQRARAQEEIAILFVPARMALLKREELKNSPDTNKNLLEILDAAASRIVFSFGLPTHGVTGSDVMNSDERMKHYLEVKPLLEKLLMDSDSPTPVPLMPRTAYYLLQLMNGILDVDPVRILAFAAAVCEGGSYFGFELDASARDEAVQLVDRALADHKDTLKSSAASVGKMLDLFVKAGWSEALALSFRLDDAFR